VTRQLSSPILTVFSDYVVLNLVPTMLIVVVTNGLALIGSTDEISGVLDKSVEKVLVSSASFPPTVTLTTVPPADI
jgi:hypothetical protein